MISGTEPANAAVVACDTPATTRPHAARVGAWALADWLIPLALALVTFAVFSPALSNNFVDWDDQINLTGNEEYRGLGTAQLKYFFTTVLMGHYIPLTWLTFGLDYVQWGMNPTGYHLTSLLLYAANAAVLYLVSLRLLARATPLAGLPLRLGAVAATLFFALHPLRAESVAWVTERRDVLSGLFFLLTILAYLRMRDASGPRRYWLLAASAGAYVLALASKGSVMVLPAMLLLLDIYPLRQLSRRTLVALSRRWPAGLTVWVYYAIALGPIIGIVHSGLQLTNDRYSYLPALGFAVMFGGLTGVAARAAAARRLRPVIAGALGVTGAAWLIGLAVLTFNQVQIWRDTETLWRFAVDAEPDCVTCHSNLGIFLGNHGLTGLARQHFLRALEVRPDLVKTHYHLGFVEAASGNFAKAVEEYAIFLKRYPDDVDALNNSSAALMTLHRPDEARVQTQRALRLKPKHVFANTNLGYALAELGDREAALKQFRHTLELKFDTPQAWFGLVRVFLETGQLDAAHTAHGILGMISPPMGWQIGPALLTTW